MSENYTLEEVVRRLDGISKQIDGLVSLQVYNLQVAELKSDHRRLEEAFDEQEQQRRIDRQAVTNNRWLVLAGIITALIPYCVIILTK